MNHFKQTVDAATAHIEVSILLDYDRKLEAMERRLAEIKAEFITEAEAASRGPAASDSAVTA